MKWNNCKRVLSFKVAVISLVILAGCSESREAEREQDAASNKDHPVVVKGPDEGEPFWMQPESSENLGAGSLINIKIDSISVPYTSMMVATQKLAASGIPVHLHTHEDELLYVVTGRGTAIAGDDRTEVSLEPGSVIYIPKGEWHGLINEDPDNRMEVLIVTTPVKKDGLGDFFRNATVLPGHPPLNLSQEEFLKLISQYGMKVPPPPPPE